MDVSRCPHLDRLAKELIEAYCRVEDGDVFCLGGDAESPDEVAAVHPR